MSEQDPFPRNEYEPVGTTTMRVVPYMTTNLRQDHPYHRYSGHYGSIRIKRLLASMVEKGTLVQDGPEITPDPALISTELKPHQKRLVAEMKRYENCPFYYTHRVRLGYLCDAVGSGKSLTLLSLIAENKEVTGGKSMRMPFMNPIEGWSGRPKEPTMFNPYTNGPVPYKSIRSSLIVIPHIIFSQWKQYITRDSNLSVFYISTRKNVSQFVDALDTYVSDPSQAPDIVLVKSSMYNVLDEEIQNKGESYKTQVDVEEYVPERQTIDSSICNVLNVAQTMITNTRQLRIVRNGYRGGTETIQGIGELLQGMRQVLNNGNEDIDRVMNTNELIPGQLNNTQYIPKCGLVWNRVIIDEADTIPISNARPIMSRMIWLVSASYTSFLYPHTSPPPHRRGFIRDIIESQDKFEFYTQYAYFTSPLEAIIESFPLPPMQEQIVRCHTPEHVRVAYASNMGDVIDAVNAGDTEGAIRMCHCETQTNTDGLIESLRSNIQSQIEDIESKMRRMETLAETCERKKREYTESLEQMGPVQMITNPDILHHHTEITTALRITMRSQEHYRTKQNTYRNHIESLQNRIQSMEERIQNQMEEDCPICMESIPEDKRAVLKCCNASFCVDCVMQQIASYRDRTTQCPCPLCRARLGPDTFTVIKSSSVESNESQQERLPTKQQALFNLLENRQEHPRVLLFSSYDATFTQIQNQMDERGIKYSLLNGSDGSIQNKIQEHMNGKVQVLCMNSRMMGAGLNLQHATDIILYHKQIEELQTQIIGRAQRPGRDGQNPLKIWKLSYEREYVH